MERSEFEKLAAIAAVREAIGRRKLQDFGVISKPEIPLALMPDGRAAWVTEIPEGENPRGMTCPLCGGAVKFVKAHLRAGAPVSRYFSHSDPCSGPESMAHMAAKSIIREADLIGSLPLTLRWEEEFETVNWPPTAGTAPGESGDVTLFRALNGAEEVTFHVSGRRVRADVVVETEDGETVLVEIAYKHKSDEQKIEAVRAADLNVLEIDLKDRIEAVMSRAVKDVNDVLIRDYFWAGAAFREAVLFSAPREWLSLSRRSAVLDKLMRAVISKRAQKHAEALAAEREMSVGIPFDETLDRVRALITRTSVSERFTHLKSALLEMERAVEEMSRASEARGAIAGPREAPPPGTHLAGVEEAAILAAEDEDRARNAYAEARRHVNAFERVTRDMVGVERTLDVTPTDDAAITSLPEAGAERPPGADTVGPPPEAPSAPRPEPPAPEPKPEEKPADRAPWDVPAETILSLPPSSDIGPTFPGGALGERLPAEEESDAVKGLFREMGERGNFRHLLRVMGLTPAEAGGFPVWVILRYRGGLPMAIRALDSPDRPSDEAWDEEDARRWAETAPAREPDPAGEVPAEDAPPGP